MEKLACFEITTHSVRMLVGYELNGEPVVILTREVPHSFINDNGTIRDPEGLCELLHSLSEINDEKAHLHLSVKVACLAYPSAGLTVFQNERSTFTSSSDSTIGKIDLRNIHNQMIKEPIPSGYQLIDIIPDSFVLSDGRVYENPPLGEKSSSLLIRAKMFALPSNIAHPYRSLMEKAGYRIKKSAVACYCYSELFKGKSEIPSNYFLVDFGANMTTISLMGQGSPFGSVNFSRGSEHLTHAIMSSLNLTYEEAKTLKENYGYDLRQISYDPPLLSKKRADGSKANITRTALNETILAYFEDYFPHLETALGTLSKNVSGDSSSLPIVLVGGGSELFGLRQIWEERFLSRELYLPKMRSIGARSPKYGALLGLIKAASSYHGSLADLSSGVVSVARQEGEEKNEKKKRSLFGRRNASEEDNL